MSESNEIISKRAAMKGIEAAMNMHMTRAEKLAAEYQDLASEVEQMENKAGVAVS